MFMVSFTEEATEYIRIISEHMEQHGPFRDYLEKMDLISIPEFERNFEQKLAMYISLNIQNGIFMMDDNNMLIISSENVTQEVTILLHKILNLCCKTIPTEESISHMLDGYPLSILADVCNTTKINSHILGESMRRFVQIRKTYKDWLPDNLQSSIIQNCSLVGEPKSPLNNIELDAIFRYLDTKSSLYVTILLNCLFELGEHGKFLRDFYMDIDTIIKICESSWLCLFLSTINCNIAQLVIDPQTYI